MMKRTGAPLYPACLPGGRPIHSDSV